jgi:tetratricopeptide (TPR) repeat protein
VDFNLFFLNASQGWHFCLWMLESFFMKSADSIYSCAGQKKRRRPGSLSLLLFAAVLCVFPDQKNAVAANETIVPARQVQVQGREPSWKELWDEARLYVRRGDFQGAIPVYQQVLSRKPDLEEARWELVQVFLRIKERARAMLLLESLREENPARLVYSTTLCDLLIEEKRFGRAKTFLKELLESQGERPELLRDMILVLEQTGDKKELFDYLQRYCPLVPDDYSLQLLLARTAFEIGELEVARTQILSVISSAGSSPEALRLAGRIHSRLGLNNLALKYWKQLVKVRPDDPEANLILAASFEAQAGMEEQALEHLLAVREKSGLPDDYDLQVASLYTSQKRFIEGLPFLERYHRKFPSDKKALRLLINTYAALGNKKKTLNLLEKYFALEESPKPHELRQAADLYDATGRYQEAIPLYRELLELSPDDPHLLEVLAKDLLAIGEEEGALGMWRLLSRISPQRLDVHLAMARLLEKLGRDAELVNVLVRIDAMEPEDTPVLFRLAEAYMRLGDRQNCARISNRLYGVQLKDVNIVERRAKLAEFLDWCGHSLDDYLVVLKDGGVQPGERQELLLAALFCAGKTGRIRVIRDLAGKLPTGSSRCLDAVARAYHEAGAYGEAEKIYRQLVEEESTDNSIAQKNLFQLAILFRDQGRIREEERALRLILLKTEDKQSALAELALEAARAKRFDEAALWLERILPDWRLENSELGSSFQDTKVFSTFINASVRLLLADGSKEEALAQAEQLLVYSKRQEGLTEQMHQTDSLFATSLDLALQFIDAGLISESERLTDSASQFANRPEMTLQTSLLKSKLASAAGNRHGMEESFGRAEKLAEDDSTLTFVLVAYADRLGLREEAGSPASQLTTRYPESLPSYRLSADNLVLRGKISEALEVARQSMDKFADLAEPRLLVMQLLYRMGRFEEALSIYRESEKLLADRYDVKLLAARALWSSGRHQQALDAYRDLLTPDARKLFNKGREVIPAAKEGIDWFSWFKSEKPDPLVQQLDPANFAFHQNKATADEKAAQLSAQFAWQQQFARELAARDSVERFEYYRASRLYKGLLRDEPGEVALLFDLAGIYNRLERPGEEAAIYDVIASTNPDYPGLQEAMLQNSLKRRPRTGVRYAFRSEEGREDKKAIERYAGGVSSWIPLAPLQEFSLQADRILYRSTLDSRESEWSKRVEISYNTAVLLGLKAGVGVGVEKLDNHGSNMTLLKGNLEGDLGDTFAWQLFYRRDITTDTLASVLDNIIKETLAAKGAVDLFPRLQLGANYNIDSHSDGNLTEGYDLWASYLLSSEPTSLVLRYGYEFRDSRDSSYPDFLLGGGGSSSSHPYYTPHNYWLNKFSLYFKHLLSAEKFGRGIPRYYELAVSLGHDSDGYAVQTGHAALFSQWNRHLLLEAAADITNSESYRSKDLSLSIQYRW